MRLIVITVAVAALVAGCSRERIVKVGWDPPARTPDRYLILLDDKVVREIPPPSINPECRCLIAWVSVPRGRHTIMVVASTSKGGRSAPSAAVTVQ